MDYGDDYWGLYIGATIGIHSPRASGVSVERFRVQVQGYNRGLNN